MRAFREDRETWDDYLERLDRQDAYADEKLQEQRDEDDLENKAWKTHRRAR